MSGGDADEEPPPVPPGTDTDDEEIPDNVPDDWLDQKPFDPAGR